MASLISGYKYDIFISYRQKDNKYDGWVTEFVENLQRELEATFKEDIITYFDINPHDGLLETHSVDRSLEEKLKCLIFIPIISTTYCDLKSFAWQHEFCAFNKLVKEDKFGRDIRLSSGNVASRILPVKIHDLDTEDKTILENELGGVLRSIEFIYKSAGVNRPLRANEDHPQDNLNKTYYRDQINKVANAAKEIIYALKKSVPQDADVLEKIAKAKPDKLINIKAKILMGSLLVMTLIVLGYFFIPKLIKPSKTTEKSIAVLPFENLSSDKDQVWFSDGITDVIITQLSKISNLRVLSRTSTLKYREGQKSISEIGTELGVEYVIEGSVQRQGNKMRITVQLIRVLNEGHIWSDIYDREWKDIFEIQSDIAQGIAEGLETVLSPEKEELKGKSQTKNPEAYNLYLQGRFYMDLKRSEEGLNVSVELFKKSIAEDPDYALAYAGLADAYFVQAWNGYCPMAEGYAMAKKLAIQALEMDQNLAEAHATLGALFCWNEWNWEQARKELILATKLNPNYAIAHHYYSNVLDILRQDDEARLQINLALELDPTSPLAHWFSSLYYYNQGKFKESLNEYLKAEELGTDFTSTEWSCLPIYLKTGEDLKAVEELQKIIQIDTSTVIYTNIVKDVYNKSGMNGLLIWWIELQLKDPKPSCLSIARCYAIMDKREEAFGWLERAFEQKSSDIPRINNNPDFDNLRSELRFQAIIEKMGLSEYQKNK